MSTPGKDNRLLIISDIGAAPPYKGNRIRMRALLKEIRNLGYQIHFAGIRFSEVEKKATLPYVDKWVTNFSIPKKNFLTKIYNRLNIISGRTPVTDSKINQKSIDRYFRDRWIEQAGEIRERENYSRILVPYVFNSKFLDLFPDAELKIMDTHDVFSKRNELLRNEGITETWFSTTREEEKKGLERANRIIAIQENEQKYITELTGGGIPVQTVRHIVETNFQELKTSPEFKQTIGFLGSENPINVHAIQWFIAGVLPELKKIFPELVFLIGGSVCSKMEESRNYKLFGEPKNPADFYRKCLCTVNPMQTGTGLKIKTIESLSYGRPVISTPTGAAGLDEFIDHGILLANSRQDFITAISSLLDSPGKVSKYMNSSSLLIEQMNGKSKRNLEMILK